MLYRSKVEKLDTQEIYNSAFINWDYFKNSTILVTGATGLIGSQIVRVLLYANKVANANIKVLALVRNKQKAINMLPKQKRNEFKLIVQDINKEIKYRGKIDFIIHTANTTSSKEMVEKAVETINSITEGTKNVLEFAKKKQIKSMVYLSSMEVYGDIPLARQEPLRENDYGYIDILKPRSSYPEGKKLAECMCSAYYNEYEVPVKIARLAQTIGAGVDYNDNRVFAEFARCIAEEKDIVLKTKGDTIRSYIYITDAVAAILSMLEKGNDGESYNIANPDTTCSIREMAEMLCDKYPHSNLVLKNIKEEYFLGTIKYCLDTTKFSCISGWKASVNLMEAYGKLISAFIYKQIPPEKHTKSFLQTIFAVENVGLHKVITLCGLQLKLDRSIEFSLRYGKQKIKPNKIVFSNFEGKGYGCNPKYIAKEIIKRNLPYEMVWLVKEPAEYSNKKFFPKQIRLVKNNSRHALKELSSAKIWIDNCRKVAHLKKGLRKRANQFYIQTWHGSLGIKKLDADVEKFNTPENSVWKSFAMLESASIDYLILNSRFEKNILPHALWYSNKFLMCGHPRNDIFFSDSEQIKEKVKKYYNIPYNKNIVLYVPSFRDNGILDWYNIDYPNLIQALTKRFGGEWVILTRLHPRVERLNVDLLSNDVHAGQVINATSYSDIQELLVAADIAITDYSSCIFDFLLTKKPAFIYATDIEKYNTDRGFYYPLETTPFPIATNNSELATKIANFDYKKYGDSVEEFLKDKGCIEDGHAAEKIVDLIEEIIGKNI